MGVKLFTLLNTCSGLIVGQLSPASKSLNRFGSIRFKGGLIVYKAALEYCAVILGKTEFSFLGTTSDVSLPMEYNTQSHDYRYKAGGNSLPSSSELLIFRNQAAELPTLNASATRLRAISRPAAALMFSVIIVYCMFED